MKPAPVRLVRRHDAPQPHADLEAERALLAAVLLDDRTLPRIAKHLDGAGDFSSPAHALIWEAECAIHARREGVDITTLVAELRARDRLNTVGGAQYLGELTDSLPTVAHCEAHALIVGSAARARRYAEALDEARLILDSDGDAERALVRAMGRMASVRVARAGARWRSMLDLADAAWERLLATQEGRTRPVPTGYVALDGDPTREDDEGIFGGGLLAGELVVVAADQGGGKTAFALQLLRHAASVGRRCLLVSQEMDGVELHWRLACAQAGVSSTRVRAGRLNEAEFQALQSASHALATLPIKACDSGADVSDIRIGALEAQADAPVELIVVDYLQILDPPEGLDESKTAEVIDANARALKQLAREIGCPVVVLSQFNRAGQLAGRKPRLQDMKGSGGIESHADIVLVLHPAEGRRDGPAPDVVDTDLLILKARACPTTEVHLRFERRFTRFVELGCDAREGAVPDSALDAPEGM